MKAIGFTAWAMVLLIAVEGSASAQDLRQFRSLSAGETVSMFGASYTALKPAKAVFSLSSELVTMAVIEGAMQQDALVARAGEALVAPVDGGKMRHFRFDARRLAATLPSEWAGPTEAALRQIAARQKRQRFWGLLEPVNLNASAPVRRALEPVRQTYLGNGSVAMLRREAGGNPRKLAALTAKRFAAALVAGDTMTIANLLDPQPFTDSGADAKSWHSARLAFAATLLTDTALSRAMSAEPTMVDGDQTAFDAGGYRIRLTPRDRAMFIASVEKL